VRHPQHDEIVTVVRGWYRRSYPEMGYVVEQRPYGWFGSNTAGSGMRRVEVAEVGAGDIPALLVDARAHFGNAELTLHVDDRHLDSQVGPALIAAGCRREQATVYLAHTAGLPGTREIDIIMCDEALLEEHAIVKLKGFANSEVEPKGSEVTDEVELRKAELAGTGRFAIASIDGQAAGTVGWYTGNDAFIFDLATRVPYRRRGIAGALIRYVLESEYRGGARSVIINADEDGSPQHLYKRLGFSDEVYWRQQYRLPPR
jgi:GNAT superfamily N-acetyltransferase